MSSFQKKTNKKKNNLEDYLVAPPCAPDAGLSCLRASVPHVLLVDALEETLRGKGQGRGDGEEEEEEDEEEAMSHYQLRRGMLTINRLLIKSRRI